MSEFQWNSVKEMLPAVGEPVLLLDTNRKVFGDTWTEQYITDGHITHWCFMPPLPGETQTIKATEQDAEAIRNAPDGKAIPSDSFADYLREWRQILVKRHASDAAMHQQTDRHAITFYADGNPIATTYYANEVHTPELCPDCKGTRQYLPLVGPAEPCRTCCK